MPKSDQMSRRDGFFKSFITHPASVDESYFEHFCFAIKFSLRLFVAGGAAVVHAFIPAWCETTASHEIHKIHDELVKRHSGLK